MAYASLEKLFYMDTSNDRFAANKELAQRRREADSTFRLGIDTPNGELFCAVPRELSVLNEKILRYERKISASLRRLPGIAEGALIRSLVIDEVVSTNELEGVHSTRRQIHDLIEAQAQLAGEQPNISNPNSRKRFDELARLYLNLSSPDRIPVNTPEDVRAIYDTVMQGEDLGKDAPDGKLFRAGPVVVLGDGGKVLHEGLYPESEIHTAIEKTLAIAASEDVPAIYGAIIAHYLFEYIHPFYDGNGRTGRYLLAMHLSKPLSILTSLSLSKAIAANKSSYYKSFKEAESKLNHGELTGFVITLLETVRAAQVEIDLDLTKKEDQLNNLQARLAKLQEQRGYGKHEANILYMLVQVKLFGAFDDVLQSEIAKHLGLSTNQARKYSSMLEGQGLIRSVGKKPLRFVLTDEAIGYFGL